MYRSYRQSQRTKFLKATLHLHWVEVGCEVVEPTGDALVVATEIGRQSLAAAVK